MYSDDHLDVFVRSVCQHFMEVRIELFSIRVEVTVKKMEGSTHNATLYLLFNPYNLSLAPSMRA